MDQVLAAQSPVLAFSALLATTRGAKEKEPRIFSPGGATENA